MIYAVFTDKGSLGDLLTPFYANLNLPYKMKNSEADKVLKVRRIDEINCVDKYNSYIRVETFYSNASFAYSMADIFKDYCEKNKIHTKYIQPVEDMIQTIYSDADNSSIDNIVSLYNNTIMWGDDDLHVFTEITDLLRFLNPEGEV